MKKKKRHLRNVEDWHPADVKQKLGIIQLLNLFHCKIG